MADSTLVQAITQNTQALTMLNGTLWVFAGFAAFMVAGVLIIKSTFSGY